MAAAIGGDFGQSKSSGASNTVSPYAALAASIAKKIEAEVDPLRAQFLHTLLQVVTQGGSAAGTPLSNQATSASLSEGDQAIQDAVNELARNTGGTANPVAAAIIAALKQRNAATTAAIPTQIGEAFIGQVPGAITSAQSGAAANLGMAIGGNTRTTFNNANTNFGFQGAVGTQGMSTSGGPGSGNPASAFP